MGGKYVRLLERCLEGLREEEAHGNQRLFLDDVFIVYLLAFFNPTIRSLRTIEDFSQTVEAGRHLSVRKICRSTLSDFNRLVDPERLTPLLAALRAQVKVSSPRGRADELGALIQRTIATDGTFVPATADVAWVSSVMGLRLGCATDAIACNYTERASNNGVHKPVGARTGGISGSSVPAMRRTAAVCSCHRHRRPNASARSTPPPRSNSVPGCRDCDAAGGSSPPSARVCG